MLDRVAVSVEQRCVPIAQGLVSFCTVKRQADIAARKVELRVLPDRVTQTGPELSLVWTG